MLYSLKHMGYNIPTIIYSTTEIFGRRIDELKLFDYSFCGQACSVEELEVLLKKVILKLNQDIETDPSVKYGEYVPVLGRDRKPKGLVRDNNI